MEEISVVHRSDNDSYVPVLDPQYVVLGMTSEYLGRRAVEGGDIAESFFTNERPLADVFAKYLSACAIKTGAPPDAISVVHAESGHAHVSTKSMNAQINAWYKAEFKDEAIFTSATGSRHRMAIVALTIDEFPKKRSMLYDATEMNPRYSYIYGVFLRYGSADLTIKLANASQKVTLIKQILEELDVDWVSHKYYLNGAPRWNEITFGADRKLRSLLDLALAEHTQAVSM